MNTEASPQRGLVARWAAQMPYLDDAQQQRASLLLVQDLLERLENADDELRADVLRMMDHTLQDVARVVPVSREDESPDPRAPGQRTDSRRPLLKRGRRRA